MNLYKTLIACGIITCMVGCQEDQPGSKSADPTVGAQTASHDTLSFTGIRNNRIVGLGDVLPQRQKMNRQAVLSAPYPELLALTEDEFYWLRRHGYPTPAQVQALDSYDLNILKGAALDNKDPVAGSLWGLKLMKSGDLINASAAFAVAANNGSLYAREMLGIVQLERNRKADSSRGINASLAEQKIFAGQMMLASELGDHRSGSLRAKFAPAITLQDFKDVKYYYSEFRRQFEASRRMQGLEPFKPVARPNEKLWADLDDGRINEVNIFQ